MDKPKALPTHFYQGIGYTVEEVLELSKKQPVKEHSAEEKPKVNRVVRRAAEQALKKAQKPKK